MGTLVPGFVRNWVRFERLPYQNGRQASRALSFDFLGGFGSETQT